MFNKVPKELGVQVASLLTVSNDGLYYGPLVVTALGTRSGCPPVS